MNSVLICGNEYPCRKRLKKIDGETNPQLFHVLDIFFFFQSFHTLCYKIQGKKELLTAMNDFLDESVVLPPGDWDSKNLISLSEIKSLRDAKKQREAELEAKEKAEQVQSNTDTFEQIAFNLSVYLGSKVTTRTAPLVRRFDTNPHLTCLKAIIKIPLVPNSGSDLDSG